MSNPGKLLFLCLMLAAVAMQQRAPYGPALLAPAEGVGGSKRAAEKVAASVMIEREGVGGGGND